MSQTLIPSREKPERRIPPFLLPLALVVIVGIAGAFAVVTLPTEVGFALAAALVPVVALALVILKRPFYGLLLIYILEYFRPQDFIDALGPLRLPFLTTVGMFFVLIITIIRDPKRGILWPRQTTTFTAVLVLMAVSVFTSINNYWAYEFFRGMALTVILYLLTVNLAHTEKRFRTLIGLLIAAHVYLCFKGILQFVEGNEFGTTGSVGGNFLGDENDFAMALILIFPWAYFAIETSRSAGKKILWSLVSILLLATITLTMSRGGFVGIAVVLFYCWLRSRRKLAGAVGLVLLVAVVAMIAPEEYFSEIRSIKETDEGTAHKRREYWMAGMRMWEEKPLIGVGPGNSKLYMPLYLDMPNANTQWGRAMHGTFPLLVAEMGAIGLILFVVLFAQCGGDLRRMRRAPIRDPDRRAFVRYAANGTAGAIVGFLVTSIFLSALYYPHIYVLAAFCAIGRGIASTSLREERE